MVPVEKIEELGAVAKFWKARITGLRTELGILHDLKSHGRTDGDRYAADRLLREIKRKAAETAEAERSLTLVERELVRGTEVASHLMRDAAMPVEGARNAR